MVMRVCCIIKKFKIRIYILYYTYYLTSFRKGICLFHFLFIRFYLVSFLSSPHIKICYRYLSLNFVWLRHLHIIKKNMSHYSLLNILLNLTKLSFLFKKIKASNKFSFILILFEDIINSASLKTLHLPLILPMNRYLRAN